jgi:hypothetical protein
MITFKDNSLYAGVNIEAGGCGPVYMAKTTDDFLTLCKILAVAWFSNINRVIAPDDVNIVWSVKCLQNRKAIMSVTRLPLGVLFEFTYNGDKNEVYMDVYQKLDNKAFPVIGEASEDRAD